MHDYKLVGPVFWVASGLIVIVFALALFGVIDALRPKRTERFIEIAESRWVYVVVFAAWVIACIVAQVFRIPAVAMVVSLGSPIMLALELVYLLRVVYPKRTLDE